MPGKASTTRSMVFNHPLSLVIPLCA
jgi:hypothetical protein